MIGYVILGIFLLVIIYVLVQYNSFVKISNSLKEAFSMMDVYLKKRWDIVPNLVEIVKGYAKHESTIIEKVTQIRSLNYDNMSLENKVNTNEKLNEGITNLLAISENYPELKANENFLELSSQLTKIEDEIANSRKYYNAVVKKMNTKIEMFPSNIIAKIFKFEKQNMFSIKQDEKENIKI